MYHAEGIRSQSLEQIDVLVVPKFLKSDVVETSGLHGSFQKSGGPPNPEDSSLALILRTPKARTPNI